MKKGEKLVELLSFFVVEFILQDRVIGDFHQFYLASVLLFPAPQNRVEDSFCEVCPKNRADLQGEVREFLFCHIVGQASLDGLVNYDT